jgi:hypothetical protein
VYVLTVLSSAIYFYGGWPFLRGLKDEISGRNPGICHFVQSNPKPLGKLDGIVVRPEMHEKQPRLLSMIDCLFNFDRCFALGKELADGRRSFFTGVCSIARRIDNLRLQIIGLHKSTIWCGGIFKRLSASA